MNFYNLVSDETVFIFCYKNVYVEIQFADVKAQAFLFLSSPQMSSGDFSSRAQSCSNNQVVYRFVYARHCVLVLFYGYRYEWIASDRQNRSNSSFLVL